MAKKEFTRTSFLFLLGLIVILSIVETSYAYYGEGDCAHEHEIVYIDVPIDLDANIILDGNPTETFWKKESNQKGNLVIKLSERKIGTEIPEIHDLNITFIMNDNYIYILCIWEDFTPEYEDGNFKDGLAFCWNINAPNFSAYYAQNDMNTANMGGGRVDAWRWNYDDLNSRGDVHYVLDDCFDDEGWVNPSEPGRDIQAAYNYSEKDNSYYLEIERKLITGEGFDVQFDEKKTYKFNLAIFNDNQYEDHAISWTYALDLSENNLISGYHVALISFSITLMLTIISIHISKNKIK
ncbi:MAG: hypothetical protein GF311_07200 [Candidatus Lokiarchaeota archaeon]|nr:hypothetical protein [Candidatus Lokiarchaeota archaeon]